MYIIAYVAEERIVTTPVCFNHCTVNINVGRLVCVLEPQIGWLGLSKGESSFKIEITL